MTVTLRCFSHVREAFGAAAVLLELPTGARAADVEAQVRQRLPAGLRRLALRVTINQHFVDGDAPVEDGDEVAVLPPVQGG